MEKAECSGSTQMAGNSRGVGPLEGVRLQTSGNMETSKWSIGRRGFQGLPLANSHQRGDRIRASALVFFLNMGSNMVQS